jgi:hypothetical protein
LTTPSRQATTVGDPFFDFVARKTGSDFKDVWTILTGSVDERIKLALSGVDHDEDYCYSVLEAATDGEKVAILQQNENDAATVHGARQQRFCWPEPAAWIPWNAPNW